MQRVLRGADDPNEVFIYLEYASLEDANEARDRLVSSGVSIDVEFANVPRACSHGLYELTRMAALASRGYDRARKRGRAV